MKKLLIFLGALFLVGLVSAAVFVGIAAVKGTRLDEESKAFVDEFVPAVAVSWSDSVLVSYASPELLKAAPPPKLKELLAALSNNLGAMKGGTVKWCVNSIRRLPSPDFS